MMIITIDGPSASGKSTIARMLARKLGYYYIYSGLLYRALAYFLLDRGYTQTMLYQPVLKDIDDYNTFVIYGYDVQFGREYIMLNGTDITHLLNTKEIDDVASIVSMHRYVRDAINSIQHAIARDKKNIVADGRDVGSIVFVEAEYKFFLTACPDVRAQRWAARQKQTYSHKDIVALLYARDKRDTEKVIGALVIPYGARVVDSSLMTREETLESILNCIIKK